MILKTDVNVWCAPIIPRKPRPLESFGISSSNGFLPEHLPLESLSDPYYQPWELISSEFSNLIKLQNLRIKIDALPVLSIKNLNSERERQRAYVLLSFMTHGYIWCGNEPSQILPAAVAVPFLDVANELGLPTTATYAGLNLWNFATTAPGASLCEPDSLRSLCTFTGTKDEEWFYLISVAMEARGGHIIPAMMGAMDAVVDENPAVIITALLELAKNLELLAILLDRMYEHCDPQVFYHQIRPFLAGSKNMAAAGLPCGVFYDEGDGKGQWRMYSGGSNAQSSLIQFFDVVLGIEHNSTGESGPKKGPKNHGFIQEMRRYMPGSHADFLAYIGTLPSLRSYVHANPLEPGLTEAYNAAVTKLSEFRDRHILIVTRYIIIPSRTKKNTNEAVDVKNLATVSMKKHNEEGSIDGPKLHGTGGTQLIPFLRQTRDETDKALEVTS